MADVPANPANRALRIADLGEHYGVEVSS